MRKTLLIGLPLFLAGSLVAASLYSTRVMKPGEQHKLTACYKGHRLTVGVNHDLTPVIVNVQWGPPFFRMGAYGVSGPGMMAGYTWNSAGFCDDEGFDPKAYMEEWAAKHPAEYEEWSRNNPQEAEETTDDDRKDKAQ